MSTFKTIEDLKIGDVFITNYNEFPLEVTVKAIENTYVIPVDKRDFTRIKLLSYEVIRSVKRKVSKRLARRYYLHRCVKPLVRYSSKNKTCFIPISKQDEATCNKWILELRDQFGYSLQLEMC